MKTTLYISLLMLACFVANLSNAAEAQPDPVITALLKRLKLELSDLEPAPEMEVVDLSGGKSLTLRYKTRKYMVYPSTRTGRLGRDLVEEEGPDDEGVLLKVHVQKKGEVNQAVVPQKIQRPYWTTFLNVYPVADTEKQIYIGLSYRGRTDKELIEKLKRILEQADAGDD